MSDPLITIGCLMTEVFEHESGEIRSSSEPAASFAYCRTTESESEKLIVTREMHQFGDAGYLPIAIARIDPNDPSQFIVCTIRDLSEGLQFALEHQGYDLIRSAFGCFTDGSARPRCGTDIQLVPLQPWNARCDAVWVTSVPYRH